MIRKRKDIDIDIEAGKANLEAKIDCSIRAEKAYEEDIASLNKRLSELASEICFEDTFEGRIRALEDTALKKIGELLGELSKITGKDYQKVSELSITCDYPCLRPFFDFGEAGGRL